MDIILQTLVDKARGAGACAPELAEIAACGTWKRAMAHARAPFWAYWYARDVVNGPWAPGEAVIAQSAEYSHLYARYAVNGPWRGYNEC